MKTRVIIMGAAGMDFHTFNVYFRDKPEYEVVAFTMASEQNIGTVGKGKYKYPKELSGKLYPDGIPIYPEKELSKLIKQKKINEVILAYSDISHEEVMHKASITISNGAKFSLLGPKQVMLKSNKPVIAVCAVRTGCGKSQTSRKIAKILKNAGKKVVAIREPMPYGDLKKQICMRFETYSDLDKNECTIEEREEYEPWIEIGVVVYSGIDYEKIVREAEREADIIIWDGGNNEISFYEPDLLVVITDAHRPGHELKYHPGEVNFRTADAIIINKMDTSDPKNAEIIEENTRKANPDAIIIRAASPLTIENEKEVEGKRVLIVDDGPTVTHGNMPIGAGGFALKDRNVDIIDPRSYAVGSIKEVYKNFPHLGKILPAMGYSRQQLRELEETIDKADCEVIVAGTPIDLKKIIRVNKPILRVRYELDEIGNPDLKDILKKFL